MSDAAQRYAVGIDLGTTHCVLSYIDLSTVDSEGDETAMVHEIMSIPQLTTPGNIEEKTQLPSFIYRAHEAELAAGDIALPWSPDPGVIAGAIARELGGKTPIRLVSSAKSWLCHSGVDRHAAFLPVDSPDDVDRISPVAAVGHYLAHLRDAWGQRFPEAPMVDQDITVTIPASFDPAARELTAEIAATAGLKQLTLLEEPQAALYSWIKRSGSGWREQLSVGDIVLVIDIGGGTTDLSLVAVTQDEGNLLLNRVAVGDHILLGGDNMDLALAYRLKAKLAADGTALQPWQVQAVTHACRDAKEKLLSGDEDTIPIVVPSRGSRLLGKTLRTELTRDEVEQTVLEGFFPVVGIDEHPVQQARGALSRIGLPYAQDAAVPRHLAAFLCRQQHAAAELLQDSGPEFIQPSAVLFNGGVLKAPAIAERLMAIINGWLGATATAPARLLQGGDLDLAVADGASYYGLVRRSGSGVRIRGGLASAYYVGVESAMPAIPGVPAPVEALCVAPFGMEEGSEATVPEREFSLVVGEPVTFRFYGSTVRRGDDCGTLLDYWEEGELEELPQIQVTLPADSRNPGESVPVQLAARVTEVGTLRLEAVSREGGDRWQVEMEVRGH